MEALGYGCRDGGLLFGVNAQLWSVLMPILRFGTEEQRSRYLPRLCAGELIGAHGMSEPDSGSDAFSLRTVARKEGDDYILNGAKTFVSNAPVADLFLVFATLDPAKGVLGLTAFLVERGYPGFQVGKHIEKMGLKTSPMAELVFEDCRVPGRNRLGREGRGALIFNDSMDWERGFLLATCLGSMERQLETCLSYVQGRKQFGKPVGEFQSVANRLVDMKMRLEAARLLVYRLAWARQQDKATAADAAMAKLFLSESWVQSCLDAVQVHGGYGYMTEYEVERDLRDAVGSTLYSGTSEIQRNLIARSLGL
jgi:alkylation response protein AidB-like acyl-CoA dehydrogenase